MRCSPVCVNVTIARGAYREAVRIYPDELIELLEQVRSPDGRGPQRLHVHEYVQQPSLNTRAAVLELRVPSYPSSARPCKSRSTDD
jgi:hypothetical protein